ncbi:MAG: hypothetical protein IBJ00_01115 [Alphaproteobacteria bacterium]|nr:hypothetical protein [Alphaproteobacteria bacterium]
MTKHKKALAHLLGINLLFTPCLLNASSREDDSDRLTTIYPGGVGTSGSTGTDEQNLVPNVGIKATKGQVVTGLYYRVQSKLGRYLDMRHDKTKDTHPALSLTESFMNQHPEANDSYQVRLIDQGNGYYRVQSKLGRYLDMRHDRTQDTHPALSLTESFMNQHPEANDSYQVRLIDQGNGYYRVQSKLGRYLDMRHDRTTSTYEALSLTEAFMNQHPEASDSYQVRLIPQNYALKATLLNFIYEDITQFLSGATKQVEEATSVHFTNNGSCHQKMSFYSEKVLENKASWSFNSSEETNFSNNLEVSIEANASGILGSFLVGVGGHAQKNFSWNKHNSFSAEKFEESFSKNTFKYDQKINVPPYSDVKLVATYKKVDLEIPFKADVKFSAVADRINNDGLISPTKLVEADAVKSFLQYEGYKGEIYKVEDHFVYARTSGIITIKNAHDLVFRLNETKL